jgi:SAM-dependent methyltransferase
LNRRGAGRVGVQAIWPLPALLVWGLAWALFIALRALDAPAVLAVAAAVAAGAACSLIGSTFWRRVFVAAGFPLSLAVSGLAGALPAWGWLLPLMLLALIYPLNAWRDAPLFPTPVGALRGLATLAPLAAGARVLDAGCGLGDGLRELHGAYPHAALHGLEWSWPLRFACAWRCRFARVRRGDIWAADWSAFDLVYLFQRPESMLRAGEKAARELRPEAWLASLEFDVPGLAATRVLECADGRCVWLYRVPPRPR